MEGVLKPKDAAGGHPPLLEVLRLRDFRLLWAGQGISLLGDQFYLIALPWLVLQLTGDALAVGTVLAVAGIPRALFMLLGGALTDRFSPRTLMLSSDLARVMLVALLAGLVLAHLVVPWILYVFALVFGLVDAFFYPAQSAIVPQVVDKEHLHTGNSLVQGTAQVTLFAGPALAGALIALLDGGGSPFAGRAGVAPDTRGIGIAFAFDALTFLVSAATLWMMRVPGNLQDRSEVEDRAAGVFASIREGLAAVWNDRTLRALFVLVGAINFLSSGAFEVGIPVLAGSRLPEGASAFGIIVSAFGGGSLLGTVLAGVLPKPAPRHMGTMLLVVTSIMGMGLALLGLASSTALASALALAMGLASGYVFLLLITWLQARTPQAMLGRTMGLLMFSAVGLNPISTALGGAIARLDVTALLVGSGILLAIVVLLSALNPALREMET